MNNPKIEEYLKKPYSRILTPCEEGGFAGEILEFPGCFAEGKTANEAYEALEKAANSWIEAAQEQGQEIPEPINNQRYGGKVALRLPRSIHKQATRMAEKDATSLNQFLVSAIAARVGVEEFYNQLIEKLTSRFITTVTFDVKVLNWLAPPTNMPFASGIPLTTFKTAVTDKTEKVTTEVSNG
ncbi:MAG: hypothetical protein A2038_07870 [Deltaproteobacteria bacterium GWA2_57_13]|nr:MAG: hypothetical protein A2038_07870 [Deltaproteobacteria bacterium GWA2_57_13]OGQ74824.1 MAG: hypothetical protein A3G40_06230 [Deltaproteobacteria bacterium RIFCSPLOWO2_12_FULL_57_22]